MYGQENDGLCRSQGIIGTFARHQEAFPSIDANDLGDPNSATGSGLNS